MVDATFALNLVETVGILVGVTIAVIEIRKSREERRNQFSLEYIQYSGSQELWEHWISILNNMDFSTYEEWQEKYGPRTNPEVAKHWYSFTFYHDTLGNRILNGQIDLESVLLYLQPYGAILVYKKSLPIFEAWRELYNLPKIMGGYEFLVNKLKKRHPNVTIETNP